MELYNAGEARNWLICGEIWDVPFEGSRSAIPKRLLCGSFRLTGQLTQLYSNR
jgi:hypothetical protein